MIGEMSLSLAIQNAMTESRDRESGVSLMGEEDFRAFYERTSRPLWAYLSRMTGRSQDADDILQEAYYRFYRSGNRHESESHRRNSLFRIATNIVRDNARRAKHHKDVPLEDDALEGLPARSSAAMPERHATIRTDLERAMQQLDPSQREILWLAYAQGASHEEIAGILGLRTISIRTTLLRARRKLAALLEGRP